MSTFEEFNRDLKTKIKSKIEEQANFEREVVKIAALQSEIDKSAQVLTEINP